MTRIDVNANKATIKAMSGIGPFNETMTFFYDESGNCRKFLLTKDGVNSSDAIKGDFVLGGVAFDGLEKTLDFAEQVRKAFSAIEFEKAGRRSVSIGVIEIQKGESADSAYVRVDQALYKAKENGRDQVFQA